MNVYLQVYRLNILILFKYLFEFQSYLTELKYYMNIFMQSCTAIPVHILSVKYPYFYCMSNNLKTLVYLHRSKNIMNVFLNTI